MPESLSLETVRHLATLARLRLDESELADCRSQLVEVLKHVARLNELDVSEVEPLSHPTALVNHLDEDIIGESLDVAQVLALAPKTEGDYIAVPKVIAEGGG